MSSEEGGVVCVSVSANVRRARSSLAFFMGTCAALPRFVEPLARPLGPDPPADFRPLALLAAAFRAGFRAGAFFLASACRFADRFADVRCAGRAFEPFRAAFAGAARLVALRFAIASVLSEP
jgi:hypothetical protein